MGLRVISFWQAFGCLVFAPALTLTWNDSRKSIHYVKVREK